MERWLTGDLSRLYEPVISWLLRGDARPDGLLTHGGRIDLRGLELPGRGNGPLPDVRSPIWRGLDLPGARLPHLRIFDGVVDDCLFVGTDCLDWRLWRTRVTHCSFRRAGLGHAVIGSWEGGAGNTWQSVDFRGADLRSSVMRGGTLIDCDLCRARLGALTFYGMTMVRCAFEGALRGVIFESRAVPDLPTADPMQDVDFSSAVLRDVEFRGCRLVRPVWPPDQVIYTYPEELTVLRAARRVAQDSYPHIPLVSALLEGAINNVRFSLPGSTGVLVWDDLVRLDSEQFAATYVDVVRRGAQVEGVGEQVVRHGSGAQR